MGSNAADFTVGGDARQAINQLEKVIKKQDELIKGLNKVSRKSRDMTVANKEATETAEKQTKTMVAGWISVGAAVAAATKLVAENIAEQERAAQTVRGAEPGLGKLVQLAGGDVTELKRLIAGAKATSIQAGVSLDRAAKIQFDVESAGFSKLRKVFASLEGITDPGQLAKSIKTFQDALGVEETGSVRGVAAKLFRAAGKSVADLEAVGPGIAKAAQTVAAVGGKGISNELLAVIGKLSFPAGGAGEAATQADAFAKALLEKGILGKGLVGGAEVITPEFLRGQKIEEARAKFEAKRQKLVAKKAPEVLDLEDEIGELEKDFDFRQKRLRGAALPFKGRVAAKARRDELLKENERNFQVSKQRLLDREIESQRKRDTFEQERTAKIKKVEQEFETKKAGIAGTALGTLQKEFFGRAEAFKGFQGILKLKEGIREEQDILGGIGAKAGTAEDVLTKIVTSREFIPLLAGPKKERIAKQRAKIAEAEKFGLNAIDKETERARLIELSVEQGEGFITRIQRRAIFSVLTDVLGEDPAAAGKFSRRPGLFKVGLDEPVRTPARLQAEKEAIGGAAGLDAAIAAQDRNTDAINKLSDQAGTPAPVQRNTRTE